MLNINKVKANVTWSWIKIIDYFSIELLFDHRFYVYEQRLSKNSRPCASLLVLDKIRRHRSIEVKNAIVNQEEGSRIYGAAFMYRSVLRTPNRPQLRRSVPPRLATGPSAITSSRRLSQRPRFRRRRFNYLTVKADRPRQAAGDCDWSNGCGPEERADSAPPSACRAPHQTPRHRSDTSHTLHTQR